MKKMRFGFALLLLALAVGISPGSFPNSSAAAAWPKCECKFPNTDEWGVKDATEGCKVTDCWVDITTEE